MWRKHWREVQWVTGLTALLLFALGWYMLGDVAGVALQPAGTTFVNASFGYLSRALPLVVVVAAILLGIGGLGYERSARTAGFTLSLPFTRRRLMLDRFIVGVAAIALLAFGALAGTSALGAVRGFGSDFPLLPAIGLVSCMIAAATAIYSLAFLAANVTANAIRSIATVVSLLVVLGLGLSTPHRLPERWTLAWFLEPLNYGKLLLGSEVARTGAMPWIGIAIAAGITAGLLFVTVRWVEQYDF